MSTAVGSTTAGSGLARVTIVAPSRRLDVALPEQAPLSELLPGLVLRAGESLPDDGETHGGWTLRTSAGSPLDLEETLAGQEIYDGTLMYLVPGDTDWPELDYDDVVEAIAQGTRRRGRNWLPTTTQLAGLVVACGVLAAGLFVAALSGPRWQAVGATLLVAGVLLVVAGAVVARPLADSRSGAVFAAAGCVYAAAGGLVVSSPVGSPVLSVDTVDLTIGAASAVLVSFGAHLGVAHALRVFVAGVTVGLAGLLAGGLGFLGLAADACAAVVVTVAAAAVAAFPLVAMKLGGIPIPALPQGPEDLLRDDPPPEQGVVRSAVARSDELLTGLIGGAAVAVVVGEVVLARDGGIASPLLAAVVAAALALRARLFPTIRHRLPLLGTGVAGGLCLSLLLLGWTGRTVGLVAVVAALIVVAGLIGAAGLTYSRRPMSPYAGRIADIVEILLVIAVVPIAGVITGIYAYARGLAG